MEKVAFQRLVLFSDSDSDGSEGARGFSVPSQGTRPAPEEGGAMAWVRKHPLIIFFILAYVLTWGPTLLFSDLPFVVPGPLLSALIVIAITMGWAGLRELGSRMIRWRVGWRWYAAALGIPFGAAVVAIALNVALGASVPALAKLPPWTDILLVFPLLLLNPLN